MKANKYFMKFIYSLAGIFVYIYGALPVIVGLATFVGMMLLGINHTPWWFFICIPGIAVVTAFGENMIEWMEDRFEDAQDLIDKIDI